MNPLSSRLVKIERGIILSLLLTLFAVLAYYSHSANLYCNEIDQTVHMSNAMWLKENGGAANFLTLCFTGKYKHANQHPLYGLLLSPFAKRDIQFFTKSKILSTFIAFIFFITFFLIVKKEFGFLTSAISVSLLVISDVFTTYLSWVASEYLLTTFTFLTWYFATKGFKNNKFWILGGFFNGLAYMSKSSGFFFLLGFILTVLIINLKNKTLRIILKNKYFYLYFLTFIMVSSPLLIRNLIVYGNPIYNHNTKNLWVDNLAQSDTPELMDKSGLTMHFETHSTIQMVKRFVSGFIFQLRILLSSFRHIFDSFRNTLHPLYFVLAIFFAMKDKNRRIYNMAVWGVFCLVFSYYPFVQPRKFMPLTSILMVYSGIGINNLLKSLIGKFKSCRYSSDDLAYSLVTVLLGLVCFGAFSETDFNKNLLEMYAYVDGEKELVHWMRENLKSEDVVLQSPYLKPFGMTSGFFFPNLKRIDVPPGEDIFVLSDLIKSKRVSYIIISKYGFNRRYKVFKDHLEVAPKKGLRVRVTPPGWELIYYDPEQPVNFLIFRTDLDSILGKS
jgi:hypothetical protein